jgi:hypothetical protein
MSTDINPPIIAHWFSSLGGGNDDSDDIGPLIIWGPRRGNGNKEKMKKMGSNVADSRRRINAPAAENLLHVRGLHKGKKKKTVTAVNGVINAVLSSDTETKTNPAATTTEDDEVVEVPIKQTAGEETKGEESKKEETKEETKEVESTNGKKKETNGHSNGKEERPRKDLAAESLVLELPALRIKRIAPTKIFSSRSDVIFSVVATTDDNDADDNEEEAEQEKDVMSEEAEEENWFPSASGGGIAARLIYKAPKGQRERMEVVKKKRVDNMLTMEQQRSRTYFPRMRPHSL